MTHFEFYGLRPTYVLDELLLKKKFLEYSRLYHPDHFVLADNEAQAEADDISALNNRAFKTLSDTDSRLKYLLELKGVIQDEEVYTLSQDFLMDMLDLNDLVETDPQAAQIELDRIEQSLAQEIRPLLLSLDMEHSDLALFTELKDYHYKKRYVLRIRENLDKFASAS